jgi:hypothetical protein
MRPYSAIVEPTITAGAYSAGDVVGGLMEFKVNTDFGGVLRRVKIADADDEKAALTLYFFDTDPTEVADNGVFATGIDLDDKEAIMFKVDIGASLYESIDGDAIAIRSGINYYFRNKKVLYCYAVTVGTPTYTATTDLNFEIEFLRVG